METCFTHHHAGEPAGEHRHGAPWFRHLHPRARVAAPIAIALAVAAGGASAAHAQHHHHGMSAEEETHTYAVSLSLLAASYDNPIYVGDYQGLLAGLGWHAGRWAAGARLGAYRLTANGLPRYGVGDLMVHGQLTAYRRGPLAAGAAAGLSLPTGDGMSGFGMGHAMAMPGLWGQWSPGSVAVAVGAGYGRALAGSMGTHDHGPWPLVEPMNMSELSWSAAVDAPLGRRLRAGAGLAGGIALGAMGRDRVVASGRLGWKAGAVDGAVELQAGLAGDPFTVRGVVTTSLHL